MAEPALPLFEYDGLYTTKINDRFRLETRFDAPFVARLALREKQVQQSYRPIISIHKWFARRPGSVFRSLLLSEFGEGVLAEEYWQAHNIRGIVADPFMGGGTTIFEALRLGLSVVGRDINPMAYWLVRQAIEPMDLERFQKTGREVWERLKSQLGDLYLTTCLECGELADVKYFLWVKVCTCPECGEEVSLFPGYRVAEAVRHPREVFHCPDCENLVEIDSADERVCHNCDRSLTTGNTSRGKTICTRCHHKFAFTKYIDRPPKHKLFGIEYRCNVCYKGIKGRQFKAPDATDIARTEKAAVLFDKEQDSLSIPADSIPEGDETTRLHRWGYKRYREMFNDRQLLGLGRLVALIRDLPDKRERQALATVFSDFLRYQNLLCRYDTYALKCQDIFSVHGFPVGLVVCENSLPGIPGVGSGSFIHFVEKYAKAKKYAQEPHETRYVNKRKQIVPISGESAEAHLVGQEPDREERAAWVDCAPSQDVALRPESLDAVFTDPPYFDNVQYAELMDFCFVWLRKLLTEEWSFTRESTRSADELTGNSTLKRGLSEFTEGLSRVFCRMSYGMKNGAPLAFTYHHNDPMAYMPLVVAILDAGLTCTSVLPAPAEMVASLHIAGTKSSILDSVFVCRSSSYVARNSAISPLPTDSIEVLVKRDVESMAAAGYKCTRGDILCLRAGHIAAASVRQLANGWDANLPLDSRIQRVIGLTREIATQNDPSETEIQ